MGNLGGGEILVILVLGLLVLGPTRLGVVAQEIGRLVGQVRRVAGGFQEELRDLVEDPSVEALARERGRGLVATGPEPEVQIDSEPKSEVENDSEAEPELESDA